MNVPEPVQSENSFGFSAWRGYRSVMQFPHSHNDIELNFCDDELIYESGGRIFSIPPGCPSIFWGARPHQLVGISKRSKLAFATVPLEMFMSWPVPSEIKRRLLNGDLLFGKIAFRKHLGADFERWSVDLWDEGGGRRSPCELEIEALVLRACSGEWAEQVSALPTASDLSRAGTMAAFIAANYAQNVRLRDVAKEVHLHPNRAAEIFQSVFGVPVHTYLAQHRVAEAQSLLLTTNQGTASIAHLVGFGSLSTFHETFRAMVGEPPGKWRRGYHANVRDLD